jgi:hypothetical protein
MIVCFSGKKRSGKNTAANYLIGKYLVATKQISSFVINGCGQLVYQVGDQCGIVQEGKLENHCFDGVKQYSFADTLKRFCIQCFGLTHEQCYGTESQKNSLTKIQWKNFPGFDCKSLRYDSYMTAREVLQYFGTNIVRRINQDAWVQATVKTIDDDTHKTGDERVCLAIITDARFPNELEAITNVGGKTVRLLRNVAGLDCHPSEVALDTYPTENYSLVVDNSNMIIQEQNAAIDAFCDEVVHECM